MPRYFLFIEYHGAAFDGWQKQPGLTTVQGELEQAIEVIFKTSALVYGSGRTDSGVHATHQVAHVDLPETIDERKFIRSLNGLIHPSVQVWNIKRTTDSAHARFDAISRKYEYRLVTRPSPLREPFAWVYNADIDFELLQKAASLLFDIENFEPFSKPNPGNIGSVFCKIESAEWTIGRDSEYVFSIRSNRFLHHMVRYLVGSMFRVASGKLDMNAFRNVLIGENKRYAHLKAPACGLHLVDIRYPENIFI